MKKSYNNENNNLAIKKIESNNKKDIDRAISLACKLGDITKEELVSPSRKRMLGDVRICVGNLLRRVFGLTLEETGKYLNRDHSSIVGYEHQHDQMMKLHYYKKIYNPCVKLACDTKFDSDTVLASHYETLGKLKNENKLLKDRIKDLNKKLSVYRDIKENFLRLQAV